MCRYLRNIDVTSSELDIRFEVWSNVHVLISPVLAQGFLVVAPSARSFQFTEGHIVSGKGLRPSVLDNVIICIKPAASLPSIF